MTLSESKTCRRRANQPTIARPALPARGDDHVRAGDRDRGDDHDRVHGGDDGGRRRARVNDRARAHPHGQDRARDDAAAAVGGGRAGLR